jgi:hypothetical protein
MDLSDLESKSKSNSNSGADFEPPFSPDLIPSEPSSKTSIPQPKYSIGAQIQAITFLELNILYFEIISRIGIQKPRSTSLETRQYYKAGILKFQKLSKYTI